jgi:uncharacterized protein YyaL (SSP411 family)
MVAGFFDSAGGGFFDTRGAAADREADEKAALGILGTRRKPFQDSPTPAGNSAAAIALLRLDSYANDGSSEGRSLSSESSSSKSSHGESYRDQAEQTLEVYAGVAGQHGIFAAASRLSVVPFSQPPRQVAYQTIPNLPALRERRSFAVVCSGFSCQPPIFDVQELIRTLEPRARPAA